MKAFSIILVCLTASFSAHAAQERGNGGDVIVCQNGGVTFYDLFEMRQRHHIAPAIPAGANWQEIAEKLISRIETINPSRALRFRERLAAFPNETEFLSGMKLIDVPDSGVGYVPQGCELQQLVIQRVPKFATDKRYLISQDLWDRLDDTNKAVMALHEFILGDAIEDNHETSEYTRYLNALILGDRIKGFTERSYIEQLQTLEFRSADYHGISIGFYPRTKEQPEGYLLWDPAGFLKGADVAKHFYANTPELQGTADCSVSSDRIYFNPDGTIQEAHLNYCRDRKLTYRAQGSDYKVALPIVTLKRFSPAQNKWGTEIGLGKGPTEITAPQLKIAYESGYEYSNGIPNKIQILDGKGGIYSLKLYEEQEGSGCRSLGSVFYRKAWRNVTYVEIIEGKITNALECPGEARKIGGKNVMVADLHRWEGVDVYSLAQPVEFRFPEGKFLVDRIDTLPGRPGAVSGLSPADTAILKDGAEEYLCARHVTVGVSGGALDWERIRLNCSLMERL